MWKQNTFLHETNIRTSWEQELFYSNMYPPNTTVDWVDTDKPEDAIYEKDIKYTFNEYGFRSDSFDVKSDINILTCGCSNTVGVGVDQHEAWPFVLKELVKKDTGKTVSIWNLATSGASADYVVRSICKTIGILNPDLICVFWPPKSRIEMPNDNRISQSFAGDANFPKEFVNEEWLCDYAYMKNTRLVNAISTINKSEFVGSNALSSILSDVHGNYFPIDTDGRDGIHPGPKWHKACAEFYLKRLNERLTERNIYNGKI